MRREWILASVLSISALALIAWLAYARSRDRFKAVRTAERAPETTPVIEVHPSERTDTITVDHEVTQAKEEPPDEFVFRDCIKGGVVSGDGQALAGAFLELSAQDGSTWSTESDEEGYFEFCKLSPGGYWTLMAEKPGYLQAGSHPSPYEFQVIKLLEGISCVGRVVSAEDGAPIGSAGVTADSAGHQHETRSDTDGRFNVTVPGTATTLDIVVGHRDFRSGVMHKPVEGDTETLDLGTIGLEPRPKGRISFFVFSLAGEPVGGVRITYGVCRGTIRPVPDGCERWCEYTDERAPFFQGLFEMTYFDPADKGDWLTDDSGECTVECRRLSPAQRCSGIFVFWPPPGEGCIHAGVLKCDGTNWPGDGETLAVCLPARDRGWSGHVRDCDGAPLAGCEVLIRPPRQVVAHPLDPDAENMYEVVALVAENVETDGNGVFQSAMPFDFDVQVRIGHPQIGSVMERSLNPMAAPSGEREFVVPAGAAVTFALSKESVVDSAVVRIAGPSDELPLKTRLNSGGVLLRCMPPGHYVVHGFDPVEGWRVDEEFRLEPDDPGRTVTVVARPPEYWHCTFVLRGAIPERLIGTTAFLHPVEFPRPGKWSQAAHWTEDGEVTFYPVSPGRYSFGSVAVRAIRGDVDPLTGKDVAPQFEVVKNGLTFEIELMDE